MNFRTWATILASSFMSYLDLHLWYNNHISYNYNKTEVYLPHTRSKYISNIYNNHISNSYDNTEVYLPHTKSKYISNIYNNHISNIYDKT